HRLRRQLDATRLPPARGGVAQQPAARAPHLEQPSRRPQRLELPEQRLVLGAKRGLGERGRRAPAAAEIALEIFRAIELGERLGRRLHLEEPDATTQAADGGEPPSPELVRHAERRKPAFAAYEAAVEVADLERRPRVRRARPRFPHRGGPCSATGTRSSPARAAAVAPVPSGRAIGAPPITRSPW